MYIFVTSINEGGYMICPMDGFIGKAILGTKLITHGSHTHAQIHELHWSRFITLVSTRPCRK